MLARLLVLVNVFLAVGLLAWALILSSNRLDWVDSKSDTGTVKGEITLLKEEIDRASRGAADLSKSYIDRGRALAAAETFQRDRKRKYLVRLDQATKGTFQVPQPLSGNPGFTDLDAKGGPAEKGPLPDGKPLRGVAAVQADIEAELRAADRAVEGDAKLNEAPEGGLDAALLNDARYADLSGRLGLRDSRRLQTLIADRIVTADVAVLKQKDILVNLRDEAKQLGAVRVNWRAQLQDLRDRQGQLGRRLALFAAPAGTAGN